MTRLACLVGPTAAGKTGAAVALAEAIGAEIVSCDSVAVYRGFDVGSAKPTPDERARAPHHLVDVVDPDAPFNAADYVRHAEAAIADVSRRGERVLVVGGTGLYHRALTRGLFEAPPPDEAVRAAIRDEAARRGWPALHAELARVDAEAAARIHATDPVRIERALEVFRASGRTITSLQRESATAIEHESRTFVLDPGAALEARIAARARAIVDGGIVEETRRLVARWGRDLKPLGAVGYKDALAVLDGALPGSELVEAIRLATRHLARRQRTWFAKYAAGAPVAATPEALPVDAIARFLEGD